MRIPRPAWSVDRQRVVGGEVREAAVIADSLSNLTLPLDGQLAVEKIEVVLSLQVR